MGVALIVALCLLIAPRNALRESGAMLRNSAIPGHARSAPTTRLPDALRLSIGVTDDGRALIPVDGLLSASSKPGSIPGRLVTVGNASDGVDIRSAALFDGRRVALRLLRDDPESGLVMYVASPTEIPKVTSVDFASSSPAVGATVAIVDANKPSASPVHLQIGVTVTVDEARFVPLSNLTGTKADVEANAIADGSPVFDSVDRLVGVFSHRDEAIGYVPIDAISRILGIAVASQHG